MAALKGGRVSIGSGSTVTVKAESTLESQGIVSRVKVGAVTGAAAMAEGLVARMKRELGRGDATVIATGGLASIVADSTDAFDVVDGQLTIKGICEIYRRMQKLA